MKKGNKIVDGYRVGAEITVADLGELVGLAEDGAVVIVGRGYYQYAMPAKKVIEWPLKAILRKKIYHALKINEKEN